MFVDLAGFTALTEAHGDEAASDLLEGFCTVVRGISIRHGLREVKTIGDAFLLTAEDAPSALETAQEIVRDMGKLDNYPDVRIGIHEGDVIEKDGDVFGKVVNLAARVAAEASAGQILVTQGILDAAPEIEATSLGQRRLRNIPRPVDLYALENRAGTRHRDPVCQMMLAESTIAGTYKHGGIVYHFCSKDCLVGFVSDPSTYVES